jgi:hypothetical protein
MKTRSYKFKKIFAVIFLCVLCYFISEGFAYRLTQINKMTFKTFNHLYGPIVWLDLHSVFFNRIITWHESLWYSERKEFENFIDWEIAHSSGTNQPAKLSSTNQPIPLAKQTTQTP